MATKLSEHFKTSVWLMPDRFLVSRFCVVDRVWPMCEIRALVAPTEDAQLGAAVVEALRNRQTGTWEELSPALRRLQDEYPEIDQWSKRYHAVHVVFNPAESADSIKLDGRAAKVNEPTIARIPSDSSDAAIGSAIRKLFDKLGPAPQPRAAKKKAAPRGSRG